MSITFHDVSKITVKRAAPDCAWTTLVIDHLAHGHAGSDDAYQSVRATTEITLHHHDLLKLPFKLGKAS